MAMQPIHPEVQPSEHHLDVNAMFSGRPKLELVPPLGTYHFDDQDELVIPEGESNVIELNFAKPEEVRYHPQTFKERLTDTFLVASAELNEDGERLKNVSAFALAAYTQALDRSRPFAWFLPPVFANAMTYGMEHNLEKYQTVGLGMFVIGGIAYGINATVGKSFSVGVRALPETTAAVENNHPVMVGTVRRAMSGFPSPKELSEKQPEGSEASYDVSPYETKESMIGKVGLGTWRGLKTSFLFGSTGQTGIAEVDGHSGKSVDKRLNAVSIESGIIYGGLAGLLGILIVNSSVETAENIKNAITNKIALTALTLGVIAWGFAGNHGARKKEEKLMAIQANITQAIEDQKSEDYANIRVMA